MAYRKLIFIFLILIALFVLTGCGDDTGALPSDTASVTPSPTLTPSPSLSPSPSPSATPQTAEGLQKFDGYLVDVKCGEAGKDTHGNDLSAHPEKHTTACLKSRASSGYGMMVYKGGKWVFYKLDDAGNKMVKRYVVDVTEKTDDILIAVRGVLDGNTIQLGVKGGTVLAYGRKK